jgi:O-antigen/teichoic acid export membrane protein
MKLPHLRAGQFRTRLVAPISRRRSAILGVVDQALSSISNFFIVIAAARMLTAREFGAFSVAFITYSIIIGGYQAFIGQELVLASGSRQHLAAQALAACRATLVLSLPLSAALVVWAFLDAQIRGPLIVLALLLAPLAVHETVRFAAALFGSTQLAVVIDTVWVVVVAGLVWLAWTGAFGAPNATMVVLLWGAAGCASLLPLLVLVPRIPRLETPVSLRRVFTRHYLGHRFFGEFAAVRATSQGLTIVLGGLAGLAATGALRGVSTLFGPMTVLLNAVVAFTIPILRRFDPRVRDRWILALAGALAFVSAALMIVLILLPDDIGRLLLGQTWAGARPLLVPIGVQSIALSVSTVCVIALRMIDPRATLRIRLAGAVIVVVLFFVGFAIGGVLGSVWGLCSAAIIQALLLVLQYARVRKIAPRDTLEATLAD